MFQKEEPLDMRCFAIFRCSYLSVWRSSKPAGTMLSYRSDLRRYHISAAFLTSDGLLESELYPLLRGDTFPPEQFIEALEQFKRATIRSDRPIEEALVIVPLFQPSRRPHC
ncbi:hypothetical protein GCK32_012757 [Trichostrongylus colubriformis]|uniref:Uncharacterized protein n=1 Tax=Trichostrongylus colubriformis TaxID=6319 RepID=A0AAN8IMC6_TRICO